jgi:hypothetical protein
MPKETVTKCGMRCDLCVAYKDHPQHADLAERKRAGEVWEKYFGFHLEPEDIVCGGCLGETDELLDKDCPVRPCVIGHGYGSCAQCGQFEGCATLKERLVDEAEYAKKAGGIIPDEERKYMEPFFNLKRLTQMREK